MPHLSNYGYEKPEKIDYLSEYNSQVKLSLLKNLNNIETEDLNNYLHT